MPVNVLYKVDENGNRQEAPERDTPRLGVICPKHIRLDGGHNTCTARYVDSMDWDSNYCLEDRILMMCKYFESVVKDPHYRHDKECLKDTWYAFERMYIPDKEPDYSDLYARFE